MSPAYPIDPLHPDRASPPTPSHSLDRWEDEGGLPAPRRRAPPAVATPTTLRAVREQRDTAAGCRERAAADLLEAATLATVNERRRMESSAANWTVRAELLARLEASFDARQATTGDRAAKPSPDLRT